MYCREDGTPYYIGKGTGIRMYSVNHRINLPKDRDRIKILKSGLTEEESIKHEIYMISVLGRKDIGTGILQNRTDGGEGVSGLRHSEETRKLMSERKKGRKLSKEHIENSVQSRKGYTHSKETREKISKGLIGKTLSEEHKQSLRGPRGPMKEEYRMRMKGRTPVNKGTTYSDEVRRKMSEGRIRERQKRLNSIEGPLNNFFT
jgi:hypothetical protein